MPKNLTDRLLDPIGWAILQALQDNARLSFAELGQRVGLTAPAVAERVRKLEDAGIISGYYAAVNLQKLGVSMPVFIRLGMVQGRARQIIDCVRNIPEVLECYNVTGTDCFLLKVATSSVARLEAIIDQLSAYAQTTTMVILSTPVPRRTIRHDTLARDREAGQ